MNALGEPASVLVLGGTSDLAIATVERLLRRGTRRVVLAGRDEARLSEVADRFRSRATVETLVFDARDHERHDELMDKAFAQDIDVVLLAFGVLGDQEAVEADPSLAIKVAETNYVAAVSAGLRVAQRFRAQGHGTLVVLSSVAGERARRANFVYGSSKAGLDAFSQGLSDALHPIGCRVMVVRPGFVTTRMTEGKEPAPFATTPAKVADAIARGLARGSETVWVPPVLRLIMIVLRHLPRAVFRRIPG